MALKKLLLAHLRFSKIDSRLFRIVAKKNGIKLSRAKEIAEEVEASVKKDLSEYLIL